MHMCEQEQGCEKGNVGHTLVGVARGGGGTRARVLSSPGGRHTPSRPVILERSASTSGKLSLERSKYACHDTRSYTRAACSPHTHTHIHTQTYTHAHTHRDVDADAKGQCSPINRRQRRQRDSTATRVRVRVGGWSGRWGGGLLIPMHAPGPRESAPRPSLLQSLPSFSLTSNSLANLPRSWSSPSKLMVATYRPPCLDTPFSLGLLRISAGEGAGEGEGRWLL